MRIAALAVTALIACVSNASVGSRVRTVADAPSGKKLTIYVSSSFEVEPREVPEDVVVQAMRASSLFFDEDIRAFAKQIAEQLPNLDEDQHLVVESNDTAVHMYVAHNELQVVAFREGHEVSRHASAIPAAAVKTELAAKPKAPPPQKEIVIVTPPPPNDAQRARELADAGQKQFALANYPGAIDNWKQAYLLSSEAMLLFRIGEAYRVSGDCKEATRFYASYQKTVASPSNKADLDAGMKACAPKGKVAAKPKKQSAKLTEAEVRAKLAELDRLLEQKLITKDEYDTKTKALLDQL